MIRIGIWPARIVSVTLLVVVSMMLILPSPLCTAHTSLPSGVVDQRALGVVQHHEQLGAQPTRLRNKR